MQGKGLINFFVILISIACLYSLSFTFVTHKVERDAVAYAKGDPVKERAYLDSMATVDVYNLGFAKFSYQYCKERELALGLDLKGGMNVTMEISLKELISNLADNPKDENFKKALDNAEARSKDSQKDFVSLFGEEFKKLNPNGKLATFFANKDNAVNNITSNSSDGDILAFLQKESGSAIDRSFNILRTRIDKFGVTSPNIQRQQGTNRILIELPGVSDEDRVRKLLQGSAKLEFWETYDNSEIFPLLENINRTLASTLKADTKSTSSVTAADTSAKDTTGGRLASLGGNKAAGSDSTKKDSSTVALEQAKNQNPLFAVLSPNIGQGPQGQQMLGQGPVIGYVLQKDTALVNSYFNSAEIKAIIPGNVKLLWSVKPVSKETKMFQLFAVKPTGLNAGPVLTGNVIADARADVDQRTNNPQVEMVMNSEGAREWRKISAAAAAANPKKAIAIVLDNTVYSAPTVQDEIPNGVSSITGNFTFEDTQDLANVLKAGRLPAPAKIVEEAIVGPTLGQAAIDAGINSSVIGLVVVLIFMIFYYNRAGLVANIAVIFNVFFIMGILASLGAVLTLPGIAGIVLTMGTAVDANVLIYERIREEYALGKGVRQAISDGYKHAMPSILDSQITTFLVGLILYIFGTGPILGFATTLLIGIITSLFTAIFITRIIFEWMIKKDMKISVSYPWSDHTMKNANFGFVKNRKKFYAISIALTVISLISVFTKGFSLGVDFSGGRTYTVKYEKAVNLEEVRDHVNGTFGVTSEVKTFGGDNQLRVTTPYLIDQTDDAADKQVLDKLNEGLAKVQNNSYQIVSSQKVGPTIANDIKISAIYSVIFSIIVIALYILIRFRKWQYSVSAAISLAHDAIILLGIFSIFDGILPFSLDLDQHFIAAVLTVLAYSINDTVVVFDRIREYLREHRAKNEPLSHVVNTAINKTLSRTIITSLTVIFVLAVLFVFGGEVIRGFSFAILIGIIFGTYSSIFLAAPIFADLQGDGEEKNTKEIASTERGNLKPAKA
ncbi:MULTISPECIES: protein translocase subunit SecDF [Olivibacter]|jgi:SecD/SecF fusion protein|uniref:Multifunctional fusion protein n=1 Tax=Olivibacter oleidegradans TaxID=760123 RepID=A0ABV6HIS8_9SPHI|nr:MULTISPECIES: protein translocase subunit SecDF [Olivibacter]MCL4637724.1 protein translocase subunit SecDF [Olivibacter sp. UJ_SKK_5.1]QEL01624.1 protein translocase subunit SecDF [Olivibacter sp. LS-1]